MKISIVLGTRPEIVKFSPVIRECVKLGQDFFILHTGQHYAYNLDKVFFEQLKLPEAKYNLDVGSGTHADQTGKMLIGIEKILVKEGPDVVLVEGDTNTVLAGVLAAVKLGIRIGHVEAGLRSYDRQMPEEINRIVADHCSDLLFAPTQRSRKTLLGEGIPENMIAVTGNTIVDAVYQNLEIAQGRNRLISELGLHTRGYFLVTTHRPENVDVVDRLRGILEGLSMVYREFHIPLLYPIHPQTQKRIDEFQLAIPEGMKIIQPTGFLDFLVMEANAKVVLTDSGGVQE